MGTGAGGTLFERPNVRVRAAAVNMFFVRESAAGGRVAGRTFFGSFLWSEQRNEQIVFSGFQVALRLPGMTNTLILLQIF